MVAVLGPLEALPYYIHTYIQCRGQENVELYIRSPIRLHGVVTTLLLTLTQTTARNLEYPWYLRIKYIVKGQAYDAVGLDRTKGLKFCIIMETNGNASQSH
jgi:hypothetical protein